jgi:hypothetical protein
LALPPLGLGLPEVPDSRSPMYVQVYTGRPPTLSKVPYRASRCAPGIPSPGRAPSIPTRRTSRRAPGIPSPCRAPSILSRGEHPAGHPASCRARNIPLRRTSRLTPCIWSWVKHSVVVLSLRQYHARDHIAQFCCAIRSRGQSCALMICARQGAIYSGGRLGIAAAGVRVVWVGVSSHTLPRPANPKVRLN